MEPNDNVYALQFALHASGAVYDKINDLNSSSMRKIDDFIFLQEESAAHDDIVKIIRKILFAKSLNMNPCIDIEWNENHLFCCHTAMQIRSSEPRTLRLVDAEGGHFLS